LLTDQLDPDEQVSQTHSDFDDVPPMAAPAHFGAMLPLTHGYSNEEARKEDAGNDQCGTYNLTAC
jgi:hypothetical protein